MAVSMRAARLLPSAFALAAMSSAVAWAFLAASLDLASLAALETASDVLAAASLVLSTAFSTATPAARLAFSMPSAARRAVSSAVGGGTGVLVVALGVGFRSHP